VSFVSARLPQALVDSERIITRLRAERYELSRRTPAPTSCSSTPAVFSTVRKEESLAAHRPSAQRERQGDRHRLQWAPSPRRSPSVSGRAGGDRAATIRERGRGGCTAQLPPRHDPFLDLVPPEGIKLNAAGTTPI